MKVHLSLGLLKSKMSLCCCSFGYKSTKKAFWFGLDQWCVACFEQIQLCSSKGKNYYMFTAEEMKTRKEGSGQRTGDKLGSVVGSR